jgi:hypothetical protein
LWGETQTLTKKSPYSHNWPYDYFSLVELAKIETKVDFAAPPVESPEESIITIPNVGSVVVPPQSPAALPAKNRRDVVGDVKPTPRTQTNKASTARPEKKVEITKKKEVKIDLPRSTSKKATPPKAKRKVDPPRPTKTQKKPSKAKRKSGRKNIKGIKK